MANNFTADNATHLSLPFEMDVAITHDAWAQAVKNIEALAGAAIAHILAVLDKPKLGELSLAFVSDIEIQKLNRDYRDKDKATNVLSFPDAGPAPLLGDVVLAYETVKREAADKSVSISDHVTHLIIHGFLHLQGYDHETDADAAQMEALEIKALKSLNIDNPYEIHD